MISEDTTGDEPNEERSLRAQLVTARRKCTALERRWLSALHKHTTGWQAAKALGISKCAVYAFLRRDRVIACLKLMEQLNVLHDALDRMEVKATYEAWRDADPRDFYDKDGNVKPPHLWTEGQAQLVKEYGVDANGVRYVKLYDAKAANDSLAKLLKMGAERVELTGANGGPIEHKHADELSDAELEAIARRGRPAAVGAPDEGPLTNEALATIVRGNELARSAAASQESNPGEVE